MFAQSYSPWKYLFHPSRVPLAIIFTVISKFVRHSGLALNKTFLKRVGMFSEGISLSIPAPLPDASGSVSQQIKLSKMLVKSNTVWNDPTNYMNCFIKRTILGITVWVKNITLFSSRQLIVILLFPNRALTSMGFVGQSHTAWYR